MKVKESVGTFHQCSTGMGLRKSLIIWLPRTASRGNFGLVSFYVVHHVWPVQKVTPDDSRGLMTLHSQCVRVQKYSYYSNQLQLTLEP